MASSGRSYLNGLNEAQKEAVLHVGGPLLIVAGAGAGKTKTITHRIAHLIAEGVPARNILAVTFTNKAAGEMRERVHKLLKEGGAAPLLTTFHSLGVRLLREFHGEARIPKDFTIWDRADSIKAIKAILERLDADLSPKSALSTISREKGNAVSGAKFAEQADSYRSRFVARVWSEYEKVLREEGALDFDDLLARTLALLESSPETLSLLRNRWTHITIDEYQDTNRVQYEIARLLAGDRKNICVVGDTDQNIYSWRGADIEHLLGFEEAFPGARVVTLEQNYRSTRTILAAANAVIGKNARRKPKNLFTENETGEPISLYGAQNELDEAWFVAQTAAGLIEKGVRPGAIAVLYRENFQSRVFEEAFLHLGIPYRVLGTRFFERKEVKDTLSYLRAALNPESKTDIARIVGVPPRGIGKTTLDKMFGGGELPAAARAKVDAFRGTLAGVRKAAETLPCSETIRFVLETSGMEKMLKKDAADPSTSLGASGHERLENVHELANLATKYDHLEPSEGTRRLLEEAALQTDQDELEESLDAVSLMTVHASKGLEFDAVFVTGLEQGLFPSLRDEEKRDAEEERRLFYVALTRAKKHLFLSYARDRMKYGSREHALPSEFFEDIDPRLLANAQGERGERERVID